MRLAFAVTSHLTLSKTSPPGLWLWWAGARVQLLLLHVCFQLCSATWALCRQEASSKWHWGIDSHSFPSRVFANATRIPLSESQVCVLKVHHSSIHSAQHEFNGSGEHLRANERCFPFLFFFFPLICLLEALPHKNTCTEHLCLTNAMSLAICFGWTKEAEWNSEKQRFYPLFHNFEA